MNESEDGHRSTGAQDERLETRALVPYDYRSDEIDLVDVGVSLWRRWKLMVVVFLICLGLGLALAFIIPRPYNYRSVIQLATYTKQNGTTVPVISPGAAIAALNNGFIPTALMQYAQAHEIDPRGIEIEASTAGAGSVGSVILSGQGRASLGDVYKAVESGASKFLVQSTAPKINVIRSNLKQKLKLAKIKLAGIEDTNRVKAQKAGLQQTLGNSQANLDNLQQQFAVLQGQRKRLKAGGKLYEKQSGELSDYISKARKASLQASGADSPTEAMSVLLINNQIQQNLQQLNNIQQKLTVALPQQIAATEAAIANNKKKQGVQKKNIAQAEANLAGYDADHQRKVASQKAQVANVQAQLDNVQPTALIVPPNRSVRPVGLSRAMTIVIGAVVGIILALLIAGLTNYVEAVRRRLAQPNEPHGL